MSGRYDLEHVQAVNYISIHPKNFGLIMKDIRWLFREGVWCPGDNYDYKPFPDFVYMKSDGTGGALEVKRAKGLRRHALEQIVSASKFFEEEHNTRMSEASIVYYNTMPFKQEWIKPIYSKV